MPRTLRPLCVAAAFLLTAAGCTARSPLGAAGAGPTGTGNPAHLGGNPAHSGTGVPRPGMQPPGVGVTPALTHPVSPVR